MGLDMNQARQVAALLRNSCCPGEDEEQLQIQPRRCDGEIIALVIETPDGCTVAEVPEDTDAPARPIAEAIVNAGGIINALCDEVERLCAEFDAVAEDVRRAGWSR